MLSFLIYHLSHEPRGPEPKGNGSTSVQELYLSEEDVDYSLSCTNNISRNKRCLFVLEAK